MPSKLKIQNRPVTLKWQMDSSNIIYNNGRVHQYTMGLGSSYTTWIAWIHIPVWVFAAMTFCAFLLNGSLVAANSLLFGMAILSWWKLTGNNTSCLPSNQEKNIQVYQQYCFFFCWKNVRSFCTAIAPNIFFAKMAVFMHSVHVTM